MIEPRRLLMRFDPRIRQELLALRGLAGRLRWSEIFSQLRYAAAEQKGHLRPFALLQRRHRHGGADQEQVRSKEAQRGQEKPRHGTPPRSAAASATPSAKPRNDRLAIIKASHTISRSSLRSTVHMVAPFQSAFGCWVSRCDLRKGS